MGSFLLNSKVELLFLPSSLALAGASPAKAGCAIDKRITKVIRPSRLIVSSPDPRVGGGHGLFFAELFGLDLRPDRLNHANLFLLQLHFHAGAFHGNPLTDDGRATREHDLVRSGRVVRRLGLEHVALKSHFDAAPQ